MSEIIDASTTDPEELAERCATTLRAGELVVLPTDTVYGVAADAFSTVGTARIFEVKRRSRTFPLPVLIRSPKQLGGLTTVVPEAAERLMAAYWPGALTIVVPSEPNLMWDLGDSEQTVAVRMPLDDIALAVIRAVGPLAVTSANLSGHPAATTVTQARRQLVDDVALYVDAGPRRRQDPSTIIDLTRAEPHILREGVLAGDEVLEVARGERDPMDVSIPDLEPSVDGGGPADDADAEGSDEAT